MADVCQGLRTRLQAVAGVTSLVSTRVYPDAIPQAATLPAICMYVIDTQATGQHLYGSSAFTQSRVRVECWATTRLAANALAEQVRLALSRHRDLTASPAIHEITSEGINDEFRTPADGSDNWEYVRVLEFEVFHAETAISLGD